MRYQEVPRYWEFNEDGDFVPRQRYKVLRDIRIAEAMERQVMLRKAKETGDPAVIRWAERAAMLLLEGGQLQCATYERRGQWWSLAPMVIEDEVLEAHGLAELGMSVIPGGSYDGRRD